MYKRLPLLILLLGLGLLLNSLLRHENSRPQKKFEETQSLPSHAAHLNTPHSHPSSPHSNAASTPQPQSPLKKMLLKKSITSLKSFLSLFKFANTKSQNLVQVAQKLEHLQLKAEIAKDSNPSTGDMYVLRTRESLPGTRYFHAQYFADENTRPYLQHMSFEIPAGPQALQNAQKILRQEFPELAKPILQKDNFVLWSWKNGYNIWLKTLTHEDLESDPFNAYDNSDVGTVRIAMELDVPH